MWGAWTGYFQHAFEVESSYATWLKHGAWTKKHFCRIHPLTCSCRGSMVTGCVSRSTGSSAQSSFSNSCGLGGHKTLCSWIGAQQEHACTQCCCACTTKADATEGAIQ